MSTGFLILCILFVFLIVRFVFRKNAAKRKGARGEASVAMRLSVLRGKKYKVLHDVLIKTSRGSSQVDHIVVSVYGIFVIETKNYQGWIHGHENSANWTQSIYRKKTKIVNPVKQNRAHVNAIKRALKNYQHIQYHPIVVFTSRATLKNVFSSIPVIYDRQLLRTIRRRKSIQCLSVEEVKDIAEKLSGLNIVDRKSRKQHIQYARNQSNERKRSIKAKLCPWCGGDLVLRSGPYGKFYGCSNFPRCKFKLSAKAP